MHVLPTHTAYQDSSLLHSKSLRTHKILTFMLRPGCTILQQYCQQIIQWIESSMLTEVHKGWFKLMENAYCGPAIPKEWGIHPQRYIPSSCWKDLQPEFWEPSYGTSKLSLLIIANPSCDVGVRYSLVVLEKLASLQEKENLETHKNQGIFRRDEYYKKPNLVQDSEYSEPSLKLKIMMTYMSIRASPTVLSMQPSKYISHIQVLVVYFLPTPPIKLNCDCKEVGEC